MNPDVLLGMVVLREVKCLAYLKDEIRDAGKCLPGIFKTAEIISGNRVLKVKKIDNFNICHYFFTSIRCPDCFIASMM